MAHSSGGDGRAMRDTGPSGSATAITVSDSTTYQQGRALLISCTVLGNVKVGFPDGTTVTIALPAVGVYEFNWAVVQVFSSGTTATATYYNLY